MSIPISRLPHYALHDPLLFPRLAQVKQPSPPVPNRLMMALAVVIGGLLFSIGNHTADPRASSYVLIHELLAANDNGLRDDDNDRSDWIELHNRGSKTISLKGFSLSDNPLSLSKWVFPDVKVEPHGYLLVFASKKDRRDPQKPLHSNFQLDADGEELFLRDPKGKLIDSIQFGKLPADTSFGCDSSNSTHKGTLAKPTPGEENSAVDIRTNIVKSVDHRLRVNEILVQNKTSLIDEDGDSSDWIELYNSGDEPVDLGEYTLSDNAQGDTPWQLPSRQLLAKSYIVIYASGKNRSSSNGEIHTAFRLSLRDIITLSTRTGEVIDQVYTSESAPDRSYGREVDDPKLWLHFAAPTPGYANETQGMVQGDQLVTPRHSTTLLINEVSSNDLQELADEFDEYPSWIEIKNISQQTINLQGYGLSNNRTYPYRWTFPALKIEPQSYQIVYLSERDCGKEQCRFAHASFALSQDDALLQLTDPKGWVVDVLHVSRIEKGISVGRRDGNIQQRVFFSQATPGAANLSSWFQSMAEKPTIISRSVEHGKMVHIELESNTTDAEIRYTLDGSLPTHKSRKYTAPFVGLVPIHVQARAFRRDLLSSAPASQYLQD